MQLCPEGSYLKWMWLDFQINVRRTGLNQCRSCEELLMRSASPCISDRLNVVWQSRVTKRSNGPQTQGDTGLVSWWRNPRKVSGGRLVQRKRTNTAASAHSVFHRIAEKWFLSNKPFTKLVLDHYQKDFCHTTVVKNKNLKSSHTFFLLFWLDDTTWIIISPHHRSVNWV